MCTRDEAVAEDKRWGAVESDRGGVATCLAHDVLVGFVFKIFAELRDILYAGFFGKLHQVFYRITWVSAGLVLVSVVVEHVMEVVEFALLTGGAPCLCTNFGLRAIDWKVIPFDAQQARVDEFFFQLWRGLYGETRTEWALEIRKF